MDLKLDVLAIAAHPDDVELACGGTLIKLVAQGRKTGILDLTRGELGTRGTPELRAKEAAEASRILGLSARHNIGLSDGSILNVEPQRIKVIEAIRHFRPDVLLINAPHDRHPDHGHASSLARDAAFLAGLTKIETTWEGNPQAPWRPSKVWKYIQDQLILPDFVVDVTPYFEQKMTAIRAFSSQFYNPESSEPETYISSARFLDLIEARTREMGHLIGVSHGEGFLTEKPLRVEDLMAHV